MSEKDWDRSDRTYSGPSLRAIKKRVKDIAADLRYPNIVFKKIDDAKSEYEIDRIMGSARRGDYDKYRGKKL